MRQRAQARLVSAVAASVLALAGIWIGLALTEAVRLESALPTPTHFSTVLR